MILFKNYFKKIYDNKTYFFIGIIILLGFISYANVCNNKFVWDDEFLIQHNNFITSYRNLPAIFTSPSGAGAGRNDNFYRPIQLTAYTLIYTIWGLSPSAFHLLNVFLHIINAILIFLLIQKIFKIDFIAFLTALLWVVHPIHTEVVTYISGTADPLSVLFALSSFLFYIKFRETKKYFTLAFSCIFFILALLSKETIIIFPFLLILYEFISTEDKLKIRPYKWTLIFLIIAGIYFLMRLTILNFGGTLNFYNESNLYTQHILFRIFTFLASLLTYYSLLFFPVGLHMERQFPVFTSFLSPSVLFSFIILTMLFSLAYIDKDHKKPFLTFGIFWFFISFIPMCGIIPVNSIILEHWLYFSSIGFFLIVSFFIYKIFSIKKYRKFIILLIIMILIISVSLTIHRNEDWRDPITFYNNILKYEEGTARVYNNLAMAYADEKNFTLAEKYYLKAIQTDDNYAQTNYNLARLYLSEGKLKNAIYYLNRSVEINPNFFFSYQLLGNIYLSLNKQKLSKKYYQKAKEIRLY